MDLTNEAFYTAALARIRRNMLVLWIACAILGFVFFPWRIAAGFAVGGGVAYLSFSWLKRSIHAIADRITQSGHGESGWGVVMRFLLRYVLLGAAAYVILNVSPVSLSGFFAGLFLPIAAITGEAAYQAYAFLSRGTLVPQSKDDSQD
jgi:hypothetical protein